MSVKEFHPFLFMRKSILAYAYVNLPHTTLCWQFIKKKKVQTITVFMLEDLSIGTLIVILIALILSSHDKRYLSVVY